MSEIETNISILENSADTLQIKFELTNKSAIDVLVLKRHTPLEGLRTDCLIVLVDGKRIKYDGYLVKRKIPSSSEYIPVRKGETVSSLIDVSEAYDVSRPGIYEVKFDDHELVVILDVASKASLIAKNKNAHEVLSIENEQLAVTRSYEGGKLTIGQRMREENPEILFEKKAFTPGTLREPKILGGTIEHKKIIETAHKNAYRYIKKAIKKFKNDNRYRHWFGDYIDECAEHVIEVLEKMKNRIEQVEFSYHINGSFCEKNDYAYTTVGSHVIWLCMSFWEAEDEGLESRAGTLVHEHSHATGSTDDYEYSREDCIDLAKSYPKKAVRNADSYEYYAESHFVG